MISRKYTGFLLEKFTNLYAYYNVDKPYNPDWTVTKKLKQSFYYANVLVVEERINLSD